MSEYNAITIQLLAGISEWAIKNLPTQPSALHSAVPWFNCYCRGKKGNYHFIDKSAVIKNYFLALFPPSKDKEEMNHGEGRR